MKIKVTLKEDILDLRSLWGHPSLAISILGSEVHTPSRWTFTKEAATSSLLSLKRTGLASKDSVLVRATAFRWYPGLSLLGNLRSLESQGCDWAKAVSERTRMGWQCNVTAVQSSQQSWHFCRLAQSETRNQQFSMKWQEMENYLSCTMLNWQIWIQVHTPTESQLWQGPIYFFDH